MRDQRIFNNKQNTRSGDEIPASITLNDPSKLFLQKANNLQPICLPSGTPMYVVH